MTELSFKKIKARDLDPFYAAGKRINNAFCEFLRCRHEMSPVTRRCIKCGEDELKIEARINEGCYPEYVDTYQNGKFVSRQKVG